MHLVLAAADAKDDLRSELSEAFGAPSDELAAGVFAFDAEVGAPLPHLAFARQLVPDASEARAASIRAWASLVADAAIRELPDEQPWSLHVYPFKEALATPRMGARAWHTQARGRELPPAPAVRSTAAGQTRCRLIREAVIEVLRKKRRHLLRSLRTHEGPFFPDEGLVQLLLLSPERGFLSVAKAPFPFEQRHLLSAFAGGEIAIAVDKDAPSRAFAKLVEAEARLGRRIAARDTCVDLGAAPGSWTYVAVRRGARVTAVDRSELRADLMQSRNVHFHRTDAFRFQPEAPVDWLLCDVIAAPERSAALLIDWLRRRWCEHFVVTLKVHDTSNVDALAELERELPALTSEHWLLRLSANKKELCAFGTLAEAADRLQSG